MSVKELLSKQIEIGSSLSISISSILLMVLTLVVTIVLTVFIKRLILRVSQDKLSEELKKGVIRGIQYFIWIISFVTFLSASGVETRGLFETVIYRSENGKVTISILSIFVFIIILIITNLLVRVVGFVMDRRIKQKQIDIGKGKSLTQITRYLIWILGILIAVGSMGLNLTFVIASVSALLVGVGFGLQNIFNDIFSGVIILFDGSLQVEDVVETADGTIGRVKEIGIRATKITTRDNFIVIVPNSHFTGQNVINWSHKQKLSRYHVDIGVAYGSDVRLVEEILLKCAHKQPGIDSKQTPFVRFIDFGESSLDFQLFFWSKKNFEIEDIKSDIRFMVDDEFRKNKVEIPFPQRDVHFKTLSEAFKNNQILNQ